MSRKYGWIRDHDYASKLKVFTLAPLSGEPLPVKLSLIPEFPFKPFDQGELGSCSANALAAAYAFDQAKQKLPLYMPSRLAIYYWERLVENTVSEDAGAMLTDGIEVLKKYGAPAETLYPYDVNKFTEAPSAECVADGLKHQVIAAHAVPQDITSIKHVLYAGFPIVFGISVFSSFESEETIKTGIVPMPTYSDSEVGGHAIVMVGYDDTKKMVIFRNSWGDQVMDNGYGYLPYEYVTSPQLASEMFVITSVEA